MFVFLGGKKREGERAKTTEKTACFCNVFEIFLLGFFSLAHELLSQAQNNGQKSLTVQKSKSEQKVRVRSNVFESIFVCFCLEFDRANREQKALFFAKPTQKHCAKNCVVALLRCAAPTGPSLSPTDSPTPSPTGPSLSPTPCMSVERARHAHQQQQQTP